MQYLMQPVKLREKSDSYSPFTFKFLKPGPDEKSMQDGTLPSIKCERTGTRNFESSIQLDKKFINKLCRNYQNSMLNR